jgi:asparagine synthase (glutamine-hydrolysing)
VASELKALEGYCNKIEEFLPGQYFYSPDNQPTQWYHRDWMEYDNVRTTPPALKRFVKLSKMP